jgi:hypothetical protein
MPAPPGGKGMAHGNCPHGAPKGAPSAQNGAAPAGVPST